MKKTILHIVKIILLIATLVNLYISYSGLKPNGNNLYDPYEGDNFFIHYLNLKNGFVNFQLFKIKVDTNVYIPTSNDSTKIFEYFLANKESYFKALISQCFYEIQVSDSLKLDYDFLENNFNSKENWKFDTLVKSIDYVYSDQDTLLKYLNFDDALFTLLVKYLGKQKNGQAIIKYNKLGPDEKPEVKEEIVSYTNYLTLIITLLILVSLILIFYFEYLIKKNVNVDYETNNSKNIFDSLKKMNFENNLNSKLEYFTQLEKLSSNKNVRKLKKEFLFNQVVLDILNEVKIERKNENFEEIFESVIEHKKFKNLEIDLETIKNEAKSILNKNQIYQNSKAITQNDDRKYLNKMLLKYGDFFKKINDFDLPPNSKQKNIFYNYLIHLGIHFLDYLSIRNFQAGKQDKINYQLMIENKNILGINNDKYNKFTENINETPKKILVFRNLIQEIGIQNLDDLLINGYYLSPQNLKP